MSSATKKGATTTVSKNLKSWTRDKEANLAFILAARRYPDMSIKIESAIIEKIYLEKIQLKIDKIFEVLDNIRDRVIAQTLLDTYSELVFQVLECSEFGGGYLTTSDKHHKIKEKRFNLVLDSLDSAGKIKFEAAVKKLSEVGRALDSKSIESKKIAKLLIEKRAATKRLDSARAGLEDICVYLRQ